MEKRRQKHQLIIRAMKMSFLLLMTLMIAVSYSPIYASPSYHAPGNVYYVAGDGDDSNPGTLDSPWRTIQKAANTLVAGETALVRKGVYEEFVTIRSSGSGSRGYMIFQAYPGERPVIDGSNLDFESGESALVQILSANYIVFDGFEVRNLISSSSSQYPAGIRVQDGGSNIHILNNDVHHIENRSTDGNAHGIHIYGNAIRPLKQVRVSGNRVHHLILGSSESLTLSGNIDGFTVDQNVVHDNNNIGIDIAGFYGACSRPCTDQARNGVVSGNTVYNIDSSVNPAYGSGSNSAGGIYADGATNVIIERNHVYKSDFGIEIASEIQGKTTSNITVRNNYIHHNDGAGIIMGGSKATNGGAEANLFANNTLVENDQLQQGYGEITFQENNRNNVIVNNLIYGLPGKAMVYKSNSSGSGNVIDYNLYYRPDGANGKSWRWEGKSYKTWEQFKQSTGHDTHSIFADPKFVDFREDIRLGSSSPAIDRGTDAYSTKTEHDFYGLARIQGSTIDIGVTEFNGKATPLPEQQPVLVDLTPPPPLLDTKPSEPERFVIDGSFSDWTDLPELSSGKSRVRSIKSVMADQQLNVLVTGSLLGDKGQLYLNTDHNADTGFEAPFWNGMGADYLVENGVLYKYSGKGGTDWGWTEVRSYKRGKFMATSTIVEISILLEDIGLREADSVSIGYVWKDSAADKLPEGSSPILVSRSTKLPPIAAGKTVISVDGSRNDWSQVAALSTGDSTPRVLKVHNDSEYLFVLVEGSGLKSKTQFYLNTDNRKESGYRASNLNAGGAEHLLEFGILYEYTGKGSNWSWNEKANLRRSHAWMESDDWIEAAIPLRDLGLRPGSTITVGVLKDDKSETQLPISGGKSKYLVK